MSGEMGRIDQSLRGGRPISLQDKVMVYQHVSRAWRRHLDPFEYLVITYFVDRSFGWGKAFCLASHKNVLHGSDEYAGIGLPERTYFEVLKRLEAKGLILRKSRRDRTQISINLLWRTEEDVPLQFSSPAAVQNIVPLHRRVS